MWIRLRENVDVKKLQGQLAGLGLWTHLHGDVAGGQRGLLVTPHSPPAPLRAIERLEGVAAVLTAATPHPLVDSQAGRSVRTRVGVISEHKPCLMAGPCSVESRAQIEEAAAMVAAAGGRFLRGGAFKPRSSPYAFSGHGVEALGWLRAAAQTHGLGVVTEALSEAHVAAVAEHADIIQVGSRNMQNFALLEAIGQQTMPVLLKRGLAATIDEWLLAGEHLLCAGATHVLFCERGLRHHDPRTRNLLDLGAVALMSTVERQLVVVDPSHAAGRRDLIPKLSSAALAAGAAGLLIEAHPDAGRALSDGPQALDKRGLTTLARQLGFALTKRARQHTSTHK